MRSASPAGSPRPPPSPASRPRSIGPVPQLQSEAELVRAAGDIGTTIFHPVGTCRMGPDTRPAGGGRRAAAGCAGSTGCASPTPRSCPRITSGNTNAPVIMIAEKAAELIRVRLKRCQCCARQGKRPGNHSAGGSRLAAAPASATREICRWKWVCSSWVSWSASASPGTCWSAIAGTRPPSARPASTPAWPCSRTSSANRIRHWPRPRTA